MAGNSLRQPYAATIELGRLGPDAVALGAATLPVAALLARGGAAAAPAGPIGPQWKSAKPAQGPIEGIPAIGELRRIRRKRMGTGGWSRAAGPRKFADSAMVGAVRRDRRGSPIAGGPLITGAVRKGASRWTRGLRLR